MVYRHPHVFSDTKKADTAEEVLINWEQLKKQEKQITTQSEAMKPNPDGTACFNPCKKGTEKGGKRWV